MRRQLILLVAATTSIVLVAFLVPLALLARSVAADRAVSAATLEAQALSSLVATVDRDALVLALQRVNGDARYPVTVYLPDGSVLGAPADRSGAVDLAERGTSATVQAPGGREIVVAVQGLPDGTAVIRTFVPDEELRRGVAQAWFILSLLGIGLLAVGLLVADRLARTLVRPIGEVAAVSHRLARGELDARARPAGPTEIRDVAVALNHLAGRIRALLDRERETVADLSHRLRTPLTTLRLEVDSVRDRDAAARLGASVDAVERTVTEVIRAARRRGEAPVPSDAAEIVGDRVDFWAALAEDQGREVRRDLHSGPLPVRLGRDELSDCVDALLGNVFAHTPEGAGFGVQLSTLAGGGCRLVVTDDGPGFGDRDASGGRDFLRRGRSGAGSSGLGLDIARRAAEASGGSLSLGTAPGGGAEVTVDLGAPQP